MLIHVTVERNAFDAGISETLSTFNVFFATMTPLKQPIAKLQCFSHHFPTFAARSRIVECSILSPTVFVSGGALGGRQNIEQIKLSRYRSRSPILKNF